MNGTVTRTTSVFDAPLRWKEPFRIFTSSLTDLLHEQIDSYRYEAFEIMRRCPHHQFLILTKRIDRFMKALRIAYEQVDALSKTDSKWLPLAVWISEWRCGNAPENVWVGVSIASPKELHRIDELKFVPARIRFVSFDPLIAPIPNAYRPYVDWIILGGESGPASGTYKARPCQIEWLQDILEQYTTSSGTHAVFVKQLGSDLARKQQLNHPKGEDMVEWPELLQRQEFPLPRMEKPVYVNRKASKQASLFQ